MKKKNETTISVNGGPEVNLDKALDRMKQITGEGKRIIKVKITKDDTLDVTFTEVVNGQKLTHSSVVGDGVVHGDLKKAMGKLAPHLAFICDLKEEEFVDKKKFSKTDINEFDKLIISGFTIGGSGEDEGICIIAQKMLATQVLNLTSPLTKLAEYDFASELGETMEGIIYEAKEYIAGNKYSAKQLELELEPEEHHEEHA